jgi:NitT/TauT family transport system substrate-binding protein
MRVLSRRFLNIRTIIWFLAIGLLIIFIFKQITTGIINQTLEPAPIVVGYSNSPSWWPWIIVDKNQIFQKHGVDNIELRWYDNYSDSVRDLNSGFIDANSEIAEDSTAMPPAIKGKTPILLNSYSFGEDKLIVRSGIKRINDLKGKKIIIELAGDRNQLLDLVLTSNKSAVSREDLEIMNLEAGSASAAFATNEEIDAVITIPPYVSTALKRPGAHELISSKQFPQEMIRMLYTTQELLDRDPKIVKSLIQAWFEGLKFIQQNPKKANLIIAKQIGIEPAQVKLFQQQIQLVAIGEATNSQILARSSKR